MMMTTTMRAQTSQTSSRSHSPSRSLGRALLASITFVALFGGLTSAVLSASCSAQPTYTVTDTTDLPDSKSYIGNGVSTFMERRCGSLDCHGQPGRPMRLYSEWGLRLNSAQDGTHDRSATSPDEQLQNYYAVAGLEPENLAKCYDQNNPGDFTTFQLLKKPLDISGGGIRHKGGPVLSDNQNDKGWICLYGWACGQPYTADDCAKAANL